MRFNGKTVLISGGGRGIGKAISHEFASEGARVAINYRTDAASAQATMDSLDGKGHQIFKGDIGDAETIRQLVDDVIGEFGHIDILVNNAATHQHHPIDKVSFEEWQNEWNKTLRTNLFGASNMTYCVAQHMMERNEGRIIFISSRGAYRGEPDQPAYGASKGAINSFGQSMALALAKYHIGVGLVAPGFVETDMVQHLLHSDKGEAIRAQSPFNRVAKPQEVANAVLYLADPKSIWSSGAVIDVNGASYLR